MGFEVEVPHKLTIVEGSIHGVLKSLPRVTHGHRVHLLERPSMLKTTENGEKLK